MRKILILISIFLSSSFAMASAQAPATLNFFVDSSQKQMIGLSCSSESECRDKCLSSEKCVKPVQTCLNCVGAKSPFINDFFNNAGDEMLACLDSDFLNAQITDLFTNVKLVPISTSSAYNPFSLTDPIFSTRLLSLCPAGTQEATAVAFTTSATHSVVEIPMLKCDQSLFPLVRTGETCEKKSQMILGHIASEKQKNQELASSLRKALSLGEALPLKYDVLQYSEFVEAQYISCNDSSFAVCQSICNSSLSCAVNLKNEVTAKAIQSFNLGSYSSCGVEKFVPETLLGYLKSENSFAFNSLSLSQLFDIPVATGGFTDYSVINTILNSFSGVFKSGSENAIDNSFIISSAYQKNVEDKMKSFCDSSASPYILGRNNQIERVFCKTGQNGYFNVLAKSGESCNQKLGRLSVSTGTGGSK